MGCFNLRSAGHSMHEMAGLAPLKISAEHRRLCNKTRTPAIVTDDASNSARAASNPSYPRSIEGFVQPTTKELITAIINFFIV